MEATATATDIKAAPKQSLKFNQSIIQGKIVATRKIKTQQGTLHLTLLRLPALSEFDHPATVEIRSEDSLGAVDDNITQLVKLGGVPNNYDSKTTDRATGETTITPVRSARNEYTAI